MTYTDCQLSSFTLVHVHLLVTWTHTLQPSSPHSSWQDKVFSFCVLVSHVIYMYCCLHCEIRIYTNRKQNFEPPFMLYCILRIEEMIHLLAAVFFHIFKYLLLMNYYLVTQWELRLYQIITLWFEDGIVTNCVLLCTWLIKRILNNCH